MLVTLVQTDERNLSPVHYSREHEPIHVHVEGNDGYAVYDFDDGSFVLREKQNIKSNDQKKIEAVIEENKDIIIKRWKEHFEK